MSLRRDVPPLFDESAIFRVVASIEVGQSIPEQVYIGDYRNGSIPSWQVQEREPCGNGFILTLIDPATPHEALPGFDYPASSYVGIDVIVMPTRTLAGRYYLYYPGCEHARDAFGDIRQDARVIAERLAGKRQGAYVSKQRDRTPQAAPADV